MGNSHVCQKCRDTVPVSVTIPADLSCTGMERKAEKPIDKCLAPIVAALESAGIKMYGSCCGHGIVDGDIQLQDGRMIVILSVDETRKYKDKRLRETGRLWGHNG